MANHTNPTYDCTQQELYAKGDLAWDNCAANQADFAAKKAKYTPEYIATKKAAITSARQLPIAADRDLPSITLHASVKTLADTCLENFQDLKLYIDDVADFHATLHDQYAAAGGNFYRSASNDDWEDVVGLNEAMVKYIPDHSDALKADDNMPDTFEAKVQSDATAFKEAYDNFKTASQTGEATDAKISANNGVDADYRMLLKDGKGVYRKNATKRDLFVDGKLQAIVSPPGSASLSVGVIFADTNLPANGATITLTTKNKPALTGVMDANGKKLFDSMDVAVWNYSVVSPGYVTGTGVKEVDKGVNARLVVRLVKS